MADAYQRYVQINLPHARTVILRIGRTLDFQGALNPETAGGATGVRPALEALENEAAPYDDDPGLEIALAAADTLAGRARALVRSDRLGQHVRNLFECLGLPEEGADLSLRCGERPDSPMR
jgi:hypothetical protein